MGQLVHNKHNLNSGSNTVSAKITELELKANSIKAVPNDWMAIAKSDTADFISDSPTDYCYGMNYQT